MNRIDQRAMCLVVALVSTLAGCSDAASDPTENTSSAIATSTGNADKVFVWLFGYQGNAFEPEVELGLGPTRLLGVAERLNAQVGKDRLALVTAVNYVEEISPDQIPTIKHYVDELHQYASDVYGRVNVLDDSAAVASQIDLCLNQLGLDGVWFDHPEGYYESAKQEGFNKRMEKLHTQYPKAQYILNYTGSTLGSASFITPLDGSSWPDKTWASPTTRFSHDDEIDFDEIKALNKFYHGNVILHLDANPDDAPSQPMNVFADQKSDEEVSTTANLLHTGRHPSSPDLGFHFLVPVIGSWTCSCSPYKGTLYNGLETGSYPRSTFLDTLPHL